MSSHHLSEAHSASSGQHRSPSSFFIEDILLNNNNNNNNKQKQTLPKEFPQLAAAVTRSHPFAEYASYAYMTNPAAALFHHHALAHYSSLAKPMGDHHPFLLPASGEY